MGLGQSIIRGLLSPGSRALKGKALRTVLPKNEALATKKLLKATLPKSLAKSIHGEKNLDKVWKGLHEQAIQSGDESLLLWPVRALAPKVLPAKHRHKAQNFMWKHISSPALKADMAVGRVLEKIPFGKSLFRVKEELPWGKQLRKDVMRSSALAPLVKIRGIAEPILVGVGLEKGLKSMVDMKQKLSQSKGHGVHEKAASAMLQLHEQNKEHEKRAFALKLLYKQAELGIAQLPQTHSELEVKLASLVNEDLVVLEKALELTGGTTKLGELDHTDAKQSLTPVEKFQASILGDEI